VRSRSSVEVSRPAAERPGELNLFDGCTGLLQGVNYAVKRAKSVKAFI
jgi:hypothetical protein